MRITAGHPRFRLGFSIAATMHKLAPSRSLLALDDAIAFNTAYQQQLEQTGVDVIAGKFNEIAGAVGTDRLVLLCFEDVARLGELSCHRRAFARWWETQTGEEVPELA